MKKSGKQGRARHELWQRVFFAISVLLLFHGLFLVIVRVKQSGASGCVGEEERLRLWCMSSADTRLTAEALDFLGMLDVILNDETALSSSVIEDPFGALVRKSTFQEREASKRESGIRLGWPAVTASLDSTLPALGDAFRLELAASGDSVFMGVRSLDYDLRRGTLWEPMGIGRSQAEENWKAGRLASSVWRETGGVWCSKYEDSCWQPVDVKGLASAVSAILIESAQSEPESMSDIEAKVIYVDVLMGAFRGTRVHLRRSSGVKKLDDCVLAWALERHAWLGHHNTDEKLARDEHEISYMIEVRN